MHYFIKYNEKDTKFLLSVLKTIGTFAPKSYSNAPLLYEIFKLMKCKNSSKGLMSSFFELHFL